jgi:squalene synthase HpnC
VHTGRETQSAPRAQDRLRSAERAENFPVALRVLPQPFRGRLKAIYDVVRTIDDLGDEGSGGPDERLAALDAFAADMALVWETGAGPRSSVLRELMPLARDGGLPREPFERLLEANRVDQTVHAYRTWSDLLGYCRLSAEPIGLLVLAAAEIVPAPASMLCRESGYVCTALQLLEHWQDVAEDRDRGRVYLPADDLERFGVAERELDAPRASPRLRRLIAHETARAVAMLDAGSGIVRRLPAAPRVAVAGYLAGGRAAADALRRSGFDPLVATPRTGRRDVARHLVVALARSIR